MQKIQGNTDDVPSRIELRDDEKAKRYLQLQNRYLACKEQSTSRTQPGEINSAVPELPSTVLPTPLNPFNATPDLNQAAILQKLEKESSTPPPPLNPTTVDTPSQASKGKRCRIQFVNYLDDINNACKQKKRTRHKKFRGKPYKYSMGEEQEDLFFIPFKSLCILLFLSLVLKKVFKKVFCTWFY